MGLAMIKNNAVDFNRRLVSLTSFKSHLNQKKTQQVTVKWSKENCANYWKINSAMTFSIKQKKRLFQVCMHLQTRSWMQL